MVLVWGEGLAGSGGKESLEPGIRHTVGTVGMDSPNARAVGFDKPGQLGGPAPDPLARLQLKLASPNGGGKGGVPKVDGR
jgi:hypothetical protein